MPVLPMFPLGTVLFPGQILTLHIFEPRYRQMIADCLERQQHQFGVVLIERGSEVGGHDQRSMHGTIATLLQVAQLDQSRYGVIAVGTNRIRVDSWHDDQPYPLATVSPWPDIVEPGDEQHVDDLLQTVASRVRRLSALAAELGDQVADATTDVVEEPVAASYQLCALAPVGPSDQQGLLAASGPKKRLEMLDTALHDVQAMLEFRLRNPSPPDQQQSNFD